MKVFATENFYNREVLVEKHTVYDCDKELGAALTATSRAVKYDEKAHKGLVDAKKAKDKTAEKAAE